MPNTGLMGHTGLMVHMGAGENRKDAAGPRPATDPMRTAGNLAIVVALVTRKTQSSLGAGHGHVRRALKLGSADMSFDPKGEGSRANVDLRLGAMDQIGEVLRNHYPPKVSEKHSSPGSAQIGALVRDLLLGQHRWTDNSRWGEYAATVGKAVETALARRAPAQGAQPTGVIEECAKIAESHVGAANNPNYDEACRDIAKAIREELAEVPQGADLTEQQIIDRERYRCVKLCERWIETFNAVDIQYTPPKEYATDAIKDIIDLITDGQDVRDVP
jgi:hypothetical protein